MQLTWVENFAKENIAEVKIANRPPGLQIAEKIAILRTFVRLYAQ